MVIHEGISPLGAVKYGEVGVDELLIIQLLHKFQAIDIFFVLMLGNQLAVLDAPFVGGAEPQLDGVEAAGPAAGPLHQHHAVGVGFAVLVRILFFKRFQHVIEFVDGLRLLQTYSIQPVLAVVVAVPAQVAAAVNAVDFAVNGGVVQYSLVSTGKILVVFQVVGEIPECAGSCGINEAGGLGVQNGNDVGQLAGSKSDVEFIRIGCVRHPFEVDVGVGQLLNLSCYRAVILRKIGFENREHDAQFNRRLLSRCSACCCAGGRGRRVVFIAAAAAACKCSGRDGSDGYNGNKTFHAACFSFHFFTLLVLVKRIYGITPVGAIRKTCGG
ncbi:hypothetical protein D3C75_783590 [compost metagenome]